MYICTQEKKIVEISVWLRQLLQKASSQMAPTPAALSRKEIVDKLNAIPTFALLNRDKSVLAIEDGEGGECCSWCASEPQQ